MVYKCLEKNQYNNINIPLCICKYASFERITKITVILSYTSF